MGRGELEPLEQGQWKDNMWMICGRALITTIDNLGALKLHGHLLRITHCAVRIALASETRNSSHKCRFIVCEIGLNSEIHLDFTVQSIFFSASMRFN